MNIADHDVEPNLSIDNNNNNSPNFLLSDDEGGCIKPVAFPPSKKNAQNDLYMRLGLLLGDNARRNRPGSAGTGSNRNTRDSCASISSLASLDQGHHTLASNNTSPVSTLTGKFGI